MSEEFLDTIEKLVEQELYSQALKELESQSGNYTEVAYYYYLCGFCSFRLNVLEQAIFYYQKAISIDPSDEFSYSDMAFILSLLSRFEEALFMIKKALSQTPGDLVHLERLGMIELGRGEISKAISTFQVILKIGDDDADIHYYIGDCYFESDLFKAAIEEYDLCLKLNPDHKDAKHAKALAYEWLEDLDASIECYEGLLKDEGEGEELFEIMISLAMCYYRANREKQAIETYEKLLKLRPTSYLALNNLGFIYLEKKDWESSIYYLRKALVIQCEFNALYNLGRCYFHLDKLDDAEEMLKLSVLYTQDKISLALINFFLARVYKSKDYLVRSYNCSQKSIQLGYVDPEVYLLFLEVAEALGKDKKALEFIAKIRPKGKELYHSLFLHFMGKSDLASALKWVNLAIKKYKDSGVFYYYKASIFSLKENISAAINNLKKAVALDSKYVSLSKKNICFKTLWDDPKYLSTFA
ncbi:MAG: tetratricopeptide repeat protein [Candidatus Cloacimonetes bacterium]|nr:tetratricopeptide repeat protein [Candidatus Cloacimonadota bacterium]